MNRDAWDEVYAAGEPVWSLDPNRFVAEQVGELTPGRALDLAGGEGRNAIWLARRGWDVELVEFSQVALATARERAEHAGVRITLTEADLTSTPVLEPADLVLLAYLQLPRGPSTRTTRAAAAAVAPGGTLLIVAHALRNLEAGFGGPPDPAVLRSVDEVVDDLSGTGLVLRSAGEVVRTVDTETGPRDAIDLLVRAQRPDGPGRPG